MRTPEEGEAADVLVAIGAEHNIAKFMVMDRLDCVTEIQELSKLIIVLYEQNSKRNLHRSNFMTSSIRAKALARLIWIFVKRQKSKMFMQY